jgi:hypothetical protein
MKENAKMQELSKPKTLDQRQKCTGEGRSARVKWLIGPARWNESKTMRV